MPKVGDLNLSTPASEDPWPGGNVQGLGNMSPDAQTSTKVWTLW